MGRGGRGIWLKEEKRTEVVISGFLEMLCHVSWDKVIEATFFFSVAEPTVESLSNRLC